MDTRDKIQAQEHALVRAKKTEEIIVKFIVLKECQTHAHTMPWFHHV